ncbi:MAG: spore coat protein U domain-containing protein [Rhizobiales bacterium]|nr:spore coat protein U domain-containing protein [Hyphomicrobiales bacterium]
MRKLLAASAALAATLAASSAIAATATGSFNVQVVIQETCVVSSPASTTLDFGTQTLLNADVDASTTIQVQCTTGTDYDVSLDNGQNATRRMRLGATADYVDYELYTDAGRTVTWPTAAGAAPYPNTGNGAAQNITVYGRIPTQTTPPANATAYTDVVAITVTY